MSRALVTGGAGFVGSHLCERLLEEGWSVVALDNLRTGHRQFLEQAAGSARFQFVQASINNKRSLDAAMAGVDTVFHLAANADVRRGLEHPERDLEGNTLATFKVLTSMRRTGVNSIVFASSAAVYGEPMVFPTPENAPMPVQTSLYGASKVAAEGLISAFAVGYGMRATICRFVSVLGERYSHGHVADFCRSLLRDPSGLTVLGDGTQEKAYVHVSDVVSGMLAALQTTTNSVEVFNVAHDSTLSVRCSVALVTARLGVRPLLRFGDQPRGWTGDSPKILADTSRLRGVGWAPTVDLERAVERTVDFLVANRWLLEAPEPMVEPASPGGIAARDQR